MAVKGTYVVFVTIVCNKCHRVYGMETWKHVLNPRWALCCVDVPLKYPLCFQNSHLKPQTTVHAQFKSLIFISSAPGDNLLFIFQDDNSLKSHYLLASTVFIISRYKSHMLSILYLYLTNLPSWTSWQTSFEKWQAKRSIFLGWTFHANLMNNIE